MAATATLISVDEYLKTTTDPDCEYVAGVVEERAVGEYDHATWQIILAAYFHAREKELGIISRPELREMCIRDRSRCGRRSGPSPSPWDEHRTLPSAPCPETHGAHS